ncbi:MAG TPA: NAD(P)-binding domain-containing protein [Actinomycetes bacterium]|nr:NAD(P)-binding domain-containing protein [Actinomycetes bacterium]
MKFGVLGTGTVGQTIGGKLVDLGHDVRMGSRTASNETAAKWVASSGARASHGTFSDAAEFAEVVVNCTPGTVTLDVLKSVDAAAFDGKVMVDVSNPLDFSQGFPPSLSVVNTDSMAEQIQRTLPRVRVVKALNTVTADVMVQPGVVPGRHDLFIAGDDAAAKSDVRSLLTDFGWRSDDIHDLGGISAARALEMYLPLWLQLMGALGTPLFNIHVVSGTAPTG